jgi:putative two-component system response regulator
MPEKILIVDDETATRAALEMLLHREGFEVRDASSGEAALAECAAFRPDLILLDILMPGIDGFEVCRRIKATPETRLTPVVLITGLSETEDRIKGINAGADDFLSKPIDLNELLARTRSLLRLKQYTDELENAESVLFSLARSIEARDPYTRDTASGWPKCPHSWEGGWAFPGKTSRRCAGRGSCTISARWLCLIRFC